MLTLKTIGPEGFGKKERSWNDRKMSIFWRESWASMANSFLAAAGSSERIDHRSLQVQNEEALSNAAIALDNEEKEEDTKYDEDGYPMTEEYQRYKKELAEVSDYIQTKSDVFLDSYPDTKYQLEFRLTSKGWPFAVINKKIDENTGAVTELHLLYNESHIDEETDEYVLQEYYYDSDNTEAASPAIVDFFLIQKDTLKVTDENTKEWH